MPNKNNKNCIIDIEITKCEQKPQLVGLKFTAISMMQLQKTISRQAKRSTKKSDKDKQVLPKQRVTVQDLYVTMTKFMEETNQKILAINQLLVNFMQEMREFKQEMQEFKQEINQKVDLLEQKMDRGFKQVNARIDNLVVKNKLVE